MKNSQSHLIGQRDFHSLFVSESAAAQLFDLSIEDFGTLVRHGHLPYPVKIAGFDRWNVCELRTITFDHGGAGLGNVKWQ